VPSDSDELLQLADGLSCLEDRRHLKPIFVGLYQRRDDCGPATCILETDKMTCHDRYREVWSATKRGYAAAASARFEHGQSGPSLTSSAGSSACVRRACNQAAD
jgi:hypothetical protein